MSSLEAANTYVFVLMTLLGWGVSGMGGGLLFGILFYPEGVFNSFDLNYEPVNFNVSWHDNKGTTWDGDDTYYLGDDKLDILGIRVNRIIFHKSLEFSFGLGLKMISETDKVNITGDVLEIPLYVVKRLYLNDKFSFVSGVGVDINLYIFKSNSYKFCDYSGDGTSSCGETGDGTEFYFNIIAGMQYNIDNNFRLNFIAKKPFSNNKTLYKNSYLNINGQHNDLQINMGFFFIY
jgi:hypothetical protein